MEFLWFRKPLRVETRLTKIDETQQQVQVEEYFRKRIEKRSIRLHISNIIPESFRLFVPHEKLKLSAEKTIQTTWRCYLAMVEKIIYPCNLLLASIQFSQTLARQQSALRQFPASCCSDFRTSKVCWMFRKRASLTARRRSLDFRL